MGLAGRDRDQPRRIARRGRAGVARTARAIAEGVAGHGPAVVAVAVEILEDASRCGVRAEALLRLRSDAALGLIRTRVSQGGRLAAERLRQQVLDLAQERRRSVRTALEAGHQAPIRSGGSMNAC